LSVLVLGKNLFSAVLRLDFASTPYFAAKCGLNPPFLAVVSSPSLVSTFFFLGIPRRAGTWASVLFVMMKLIDNQSLADSGSPICASKLNFRCGKVSNQSFLRWF
jgi:hypothetical protein